MLIDHELQDPGLSNLSLLVTRRNPPYQQPENIIVGCDNCKRGHLDLYWECQLCGDSGPQYCCECKEIGVLCTNKEHKLALSEPYSRIDVDMTRTPQSAIVEFIAHELQTHSGISSQAAIQSAADVSAKVGGNVNLAKLKVDDMLAADDLTDGQMLRDRLPRSVIAFFDAEINCILQRNLVDRDLGLLAIVAVSKYEDPRGYGMKAADLEKSIRQELNSSPHLARHPTRSLEDVITAANGLLVLQPYEDDLYVACFNKMLRFYAKEDYNEHLYKAKLKLCPGRDDLQHEVISSWNIAPSTTSPPTLSDAFDSKDYMDARSSSQDSAYYSRSSTMNTRLSCLTTVPHTDEPRGLFENTDSLPIQSSVIEVQEHIARPMTLCKFCQDQVLNSRNCAGTHHMSGEAIMNSLSIRCFICTDLYLHGFDADSPILELNSNSFKHFRYEWAFRSTGRTQNINDSSFQIYFTPFSNDGGGMARLPRSKRYHVLSETDVHVAPEKTLTPFTNPNKLGGGLQIREWMKACAETHENCNKHRKSEFVPTRLVDLEIGNTDMVRVVNTAKENITGPYLTLSHSWGPPNFLQLKRENESRLTGEGVIIRELTLNFQQAISVAKFIGIRYIWIDSLCIMVCIRVSPSTTIILIVRSKVQEETLRAKVSLCTKCTATLTATLLSQTLQILRGVYSGNAAQRTLCL